MPESRRQAFQNEAKCGEVVWGEFVRDWRRGYHRTMSRSLLLSTWVTLALLGHAQDAGGPSDLSALAKVLSFETDHPGGRPGGWSGGPLATLFADDRVVHGGRWSARLERNAESANGFSTITKGIPADFAGKTIELRGFLRTEGVSEFVGLWLREDGEGNTSLAFDNMQRREIKGTHDWTEYSIVLPLRAEARMIFFGALIGGTGKLWADDLQLLVDGKPVWEAPKVERPKTPADTDHEFDKGSGITLTELSKGQTDNLATLGRVWGFLKYHHPEVTSGKRHWDYELFRVMPGVLAAGDRAAANAAMAKWIAALGEVRKCGPCVTLDEANLHLRPENEWLADEALLGSELSKSLRAIHANRLKGKQYYVSFAPGVGNPVFDHEGAYPGVRLPDAGYQLLGLYRFWNIIQYWSPYRDVLGEDWAGVLAQFVPRIALAMNAEGYQRELMALIARDHDTHANLWSSLRVRPPVGACQLPFVVRFVENLPVVAGYTAGEAGKATGMKAGDAILELDGVPVKKLIEDWSPYYAASNEPTRMRDIARGMTRGDCGPAKVRIRRDSGETLEITTARVTAAAADRGGATHDRPDATFQRLSADVAYLKLSSVKAAETAKYVDSASGTKGLIIDIRNYPSEFVVFALGSLLVDKESEFARFTVGDASNPGAFHWTPPLKLSPQKPHYAGKVIILVDEVSQSQAEYTTMALRTAPGAKVLGSTTAGADGNVSPIPLPGGLSSMISGIGVFYPDKKPTQRVGILADTEVKPTIAGIRSERDEVLEEAVRQILGPQATPAEIEKTLKK
jgi:C-terminal processing protease CtpA/Prc